VDVIKHKNRFKPNMLVHRWPLVQIPAKTLSILPEVCHGFCQSLQDATSSFMYPTVRSIRVQRRKTRYLVWPNHISLLFSPRSSCWVWGGYVPGPASPEFQPPCNTQTCGTEVGSTTLCVGLSSSWWKRMNLQWPIRQVSEPWRSMKTNLYVIYNQVKLPNKI
jgi:hypothetical protein